MGVNMDKKIFGKRLNLALKDKGITSERLSELCNLNATYVRQIEAGIKTPSLPVFVAICKELKVSPSYLLIGEFDDSVHEIDALLELCANASPSQVRMITAMIKGALDNVD